MMALTRLVERIEPVVLVMVELAAVVVQAVAVEVVVEPGKAVADRDWS